ncbi:MAG: hypothetical protein ACLFUE_08745, partial [Desulfobacteraceae bacterium]
MSEYLEAISRFASDLSLDQLPSKVVERAAEVTADTMAVVAAGGMEEEVKGLTAEKLTEWKGPMYAFFEAEFGVRMLRATERIRAVAAD